MCKCENGFFLHMGMLWIVRQDTLIRVHHSPAEVTNVNHILTEWNYLIQV